MFRRAVTRVSVRGYTRNWSTAKDLKSMSSAEVNQEIATATWSESDLQSQMMSLFGVDEATYRARVVPELLAHVKISTADFPPPSKVHMNVTEDDQKVLGENAYKVLSDAVSKSKLDINTDWLVEQAWAKASLQRASIENTAAEKFEALAATFASAISESIGASRSALDAVAKAEVPVEGEMPAYSPPDKDWLEGAPEL